ncbi:hypothetical protein FRAHR75_1340009 [Frankia sp. Hr75.2]|nr:hypothetical protein FRAHR75_1340009 [Frankia sp. Hr75.2]
MGAAPTIGRHPDVVCHQPVGAVRRRRGCLGSGVSAGRRPARMACDGYHKAGDNRVVVRIVVNPVDHRHPDQLEATFDH